MATESYLGVLCQNQRSKTPPCGFKCSLAEGLRFNFGEKVVFPTRVVNACVLGLTAVISYTPFEFMFENIRLPRLF